ncbi:MAG: hypothetical protein PWP27_1195 [Clostridiales bacterium]|nr:hypothetical protein [Clostridiales bacterium]MDK2933385.1 hypothetical protein [Clostridiales bacterium]
MLNKQKECVLENKFCINCKLCHFCDLDKNKICNNCSKCIEDDVDYKAIEIDDILQIEVHK